MKLLPFGAVRLASFAVLAGLAAAQPASALEKISYGLSWLPEAEHCGFYQAKATGLYEKAGLDVDIVPGGPNLNVPILVAAGKLDLGMGDSFTTLAMVNEGVKARTVAAFFQKDPQTLVAHADQGVSKLQDLKGRPIMIAKTAQSGYWLFLKQKFGFTDDQVRPYTYSAAPFLADPKAVQQGYITEDVYLLGQNLPKPPVPILLADYGYADYATTVFGTDAYLTSHKDAVATFLKVSVEGWKQCMAGSYDAAMKAIMKANPEHTEGLFHFKMKEMKAREMVDGGDAAKAGIGTMTDARWKEFFDTMSTAGIYPKSLDYKQAFSLDYLPK